MTPAALQTSFTNYIRNLYSTPENFFRDKVDKKHFVHDGTDSKLRVEEDYEFNPRVTVPAPSVWVGVGDLQLKDSAIRNESSTNMSYDDGRTVTVIATLPLSIRHVNRSPHEASEMATNTMFFLVSSADSLADHMMLSSVRVGIVSKPKLLNPESADRLFESVVQGAITYQLSLIVRNETNIIKKIEAVKNMG